MKTLSAKEALVFQTACLQAQLNVPQLAKQLRMQPYTVRRLLGFLHEKGIFRGRRPFLNPSVLDMMVYLIYFSLNGGTKATRLAFVKALCDHEHTVSVSEVGGDYQYEVRFLSHCSHAIYEFLGSLAAQFTVSIETPGVAIVHDEEYSGLRLVKAESPRLRSLKWDPSPQKIKLDEIDHKILSLIGNNSIESYQEIARHLGIPASTVTYRMVKFEKCGLIKGYCNLFDSAVFGNLPMVLLMSSQLMTKTQRLELANYCRQHMQVVILENLIGPWQARIHTSVHNYGEALLIMHELSEMFSSVIRGIRILPQLRFFKHTLYPFRHFSSVS